MIGLIAAFCIGMALSITLTPYFIRFLVKNHYGQFIRHDGPTQHQTKRGTPTMGGVVFIITTVVGWLCGSLLNGGIDWASIMLVFLFVGLGVIGLLDDAIKILRQRSLGLRASAKIFGQIAVASIFGAGILMNPMADDYVPVSTAISLARPTAWDLALLGMPVMIILFLIWVNFLVAAWSNAVNLTDGLDGLATGCSIFAFGAYAIISYFQWIQDCDGQVAHQSACFSTTQPLSMAVFSAALVGSLAGFLWWNASPARIFMGDTGALALGGAFAGLSILTETQFLAVAIGALFVAVVLSDVIQVGVFKLTRKRVFRMAPLHHHFELLGWSEVTIVIRFWLIAALCAFGGMGLFYLDWISRT